MKSATQQSTASNLTLRYLGFQILIAAVVALFLGRLLYLQVFQSSVYANRASENSQRVQIIPPKRGQIFDRNFDVPLATNYDSYVLMMNPSDTSTKAAAAVLEKLAKHLGVPLSGILKKLPAKLQLYHPFDLDLTVKYPDVVYLAEHRDEFPGISWETRSVRSYPEGKSMAQVIGSVGQITQEELQVMYNHGYTDNSVIGKSGIEKFYNELMQGKEGKRLSTIDADGRSLLLNNDGIEVAPQLGKTLVLTLDRKIQTLAERALGSRIGSVVVLKPATGEILAMVSYPSYDPNRLYSDDSSAVLGRLLQDKRSPFLNRAIQAAAPPASTFKILMTTAVLEEKAFPKTSKIQDPGYIMVGNRRFNCWEPSGHGYVDLFQALAESCNVYYYTVGTQHLGAQKILDYSSRFGFGKITGVDLPGEITGNVPSPEWKQETTGSPWLGGDTANLSIGQGYLETTPIQLANMVSAVVNNGVVYQPHLLKEVRDSATYQVLDTETPKVLGDLKLRPDTIQDVKTAMRGVVTNGTAAPVMTTKAVQIAAKTGTGQTSKKEDQHSWFVSYAPYDYTDVNDVVAVVVWVDASNPWEWWAPKAANIIYQGIFANQDYEAAVKALQPWDFLSTPEPAPKGAEESP